MTTTNKMAQLPQQVQDQLKQERENQVFSKTYDLNWNPPVIKTYCECEMKKGKKVTLFIRKGYDYRNRPTPSTTLIDKDNKYTSLWDGSLKQVEDTIAFYEIDLENTKKKIDQLKNIKENTNQEVCDLYNMQGDIIHTPRNIMSLRKFLVKCPLWIPSGQMTLSVSYNDKDYEHIASQMANYPELEPLFEKMRTYKVKVDEINKTRKNPRRNCHAQITFENDTIRVSEVNWTIWREGHIFYH